MTTIKRRALALAIAMTTATAVMAYDPSARAATQAYTGTVSATGTSWASFTFTNVATSTVTASVSWPPASGANLNIFLLDGGGRTLAQSSSTTADPEALTLPNVAAGSYRIGVKAVSGSAAFTVTLTTTPAIVGTPLLSQWMSPFEAPNGTFTQAQAVAAATATDIVIATRYQYRGLVNAMRGANPKVVVYAYSNAAAIAPSDVSLYASNLFAKDATGKRVKSMYGNYIMDISKPGWLTSRVNDCKNALALSGYDGCYYDMLGSGLLFPGYLSALPINPATGVAWTHAQWIARTSQMIQQIRAALPGRPIIGNGTNNGRRYWANPGGSKPLVNTVKTIVTECYIRLPNEPINVAIGFARWKQDLDMITDAEANGNALLVETKVEVPATQAQLDKWHKFSLASFLLGTNGRSKYEFTTTLDLSTHYTDDPWARPNLGAPAGSYYVHSTGAYVRDFQGGKVVVNPTSASITVPLGRAYTTLDGRSVSSLTLAPETGEVLD